jgi:murein L,D-transpeptidase YcbB/YkuD
VPDPVAVTLAYRTIWADPSGQVQVRADLYGHDASEAETLAAAVVALAE